MLLARQIQQSQHGAHWAPQLLSPSVRSHCLIWASDCVREGKPNKGQQGKKAQRELTWAPESVPLLGSSLNLSKAGAPQILFGGRQETNSAWNGDCPHWWHLALITDHLPSGEAPKAHLCSPVPLHWHSPLSRVNQNKDLQHKFTKSFAKLKKIIITKPQRKHKSKAKQPTQRKNISGEFGPLFAAMNRTKNSNLQRHEPDL